MRLVEIAVGKIGVVGRDERQVVTIGQLDQTRLGPRLLGRAMAHQLDVEPVRKHARRAWIRARLGGFGLTLGEQPPDRTARPAGEAEQPLARRSEIGSGDRRLGRQPRRRDRIG